MQDLRPPPRMQRRVVLLYPSPIARHLPKPPRLTDAERVVLDKYDGCRKCRKLFVGHWAADCPDGFASGLNYVPITEATATAARAALHVLAPGPSSHVIKKEPVVAAVLG